MAKEDDAAGDALYALLTGLAGRRLKNQDIWEAFGLSKAQFYEARKSGKLAQRADRIVSAAHHLKINPIELLIALVPGIELGEAVEFVERKRAESAQFLSGSTPVPSGDVDDVRNYLRSALSQSPDEHGVKERGNLA